MKERTANTISDAIALSSPSGRMSKRARKVAEQRLCMALFGKPDITLSDVQGERPEETAAEKLAWKIGQLRSLAKLASPRQAKKLLKEAADLESQNS